MNAARRYYWLRCVIPSSHSHFSPSYVWQWDGEDNVGVMEGGAEGQGVVAVGRVNPLIPLGMDLCEQNSASRVSGR